MRSQGERAGGLAQGKRGKMVECGPILCSHQTGLEGFEKDFPMACWATEEREKQK